MRNDVTLSLVRSYPFFTVESQKLLAAGEDKPTVDECTDQRGGRSIDIGREGRLMRLGQTCIASDVYKFERVAYRSDSAFL